MNCEAMANKRLLAGRAILYELFHLFYEHDSAKCNFHALIFMAYVRTKLKMSFAGYHVMEKVLF